MKQYTILLVRFPFDDLSGNKVRPVLCLTEPLGKWKHLIVAFISSRVSSTLESHEVLINDQVEDFDETGLHTSSVIQLQRLLSVQENAILRELGVLPTSLQESVKAKLTTMFLS
jgi:mRNA interferase MazF